MSKTLEFSGPVMRTAAGFHPNQARRQLREERRHLVAFELLLQHRPATLIDPMHLEHILCKVNANRRNLHRGRSPRFKWLISASTLAHRCRCEWGRPSHCFAEKRMAGVGRKRRRATALRDSTVQLLSARRRRSTTFSKANA